MTRLAVDDLHAPAELVSEIGGPRDDGDGSVNGGERIAELVGEHREELILASIHIRQLRGTATKLLLDPTPLDRVAKGTPEERTVDLSLDQVILRSRLDRPIRELLVVGAGQDNDGDGRRVRADTQERVQALALGKR